MGGGGEGWLSDKGSNTSCTKICSAHFKVVSEFFSLTRMRELLWQARRIILRLRFLIFFLIYYYYLLKIIYTNRNQLARTNSTLLCQRSVHNGSASRDKMVFTGTGKSICTTLRLQQGLFFFLVMSLKRSQCWSHWRWLFLVLWRKIAQRFDPPSTPLFLKHGKIYANVK